MDSASYTSTFVESLPRVLIYTALSLPCLFIVIILLNHHLAVPPPPSPAGCRRLGLIKHSNLSDEHHARYQPAFSFSSSSAPQDIRIKSLHIFPIKSCRGVELSTARTVPTGLAYDRQFSFAQLKSPFPLSTTDTEEVKSDHSWKFITQREFPLMSQVKTQMWVPDPKAAGYDADAKFVRSKGAIVVTFPWAADGWRCALAQLATKLLLQRAELPEMSFVVPFEPPTEEYPLEQFTIWKETVPALNLAPLMPPELAYFLGVRNPMSLFRVANPREVFRCAPRLAGGGVRYQPITGFADAYPVHLLGVESVRELESGQVEGSPSLSCMRFRPNVVTEGATPYQEEDWKKVRLIRSAGAEAKVDDGEGVWYVACRCVRCLMPNIEPATGVRHRSEPNRTLRALRKVDKGAPLHGCLGMNLVAEREEGKISVGDAVQVLEVGEHVYLPL